MFAKIWLKEWRENFLIFLLSVVFIIGLAVLNLSNLRELILSLSGAFLLLFLPISALLIGSGGFASEFKDNAWIYLLSRPINKESIWVYKFVSLLSVLAVIFGLFFMAKGFLPDLNTIIKETYVPSELIGEYSFSLYFLLPVLLFAISFSISFIYEKQFIVVFISLLATGALAYSIQRFYVFLWETFLYSGNLHGLHVLVFLSFISASILAFRSSDFSQQRRKIVFFSRYLVLFLALSFLLSLAWVAGEDLVLKRRRELNIVTSVKDKENIYFTRYVGGIIKYNTKKNKAEKMAPEAHVMFEELTTGGGKIAFFDEIKGDKWHKNLRILNIDGSGEKTLVESSSPISPFNKSDFLGNCLLTADGEKIAFATACIKEIRARRRSAVLWWLNSDGTGLRSQKMNFSNYCLELKLISWFLDSKSVLLSIKETPSKYRILIAYMDNNYEEIAKDVLYGPNKIKVSPDKNYLIYVLDSDKEKKEELILLDLKNNEKRSILEASRLNNLHGIRWCPEGDELAFTLGNELWVYSLNKNTIKKIVTCPFLDCSIRFDWATEGHKIVMITPLYNENYLVALRENLPTVTGGFIENHGIKIPDQIIMPQYIWAVKDMVIIYDTTKTRLWSLNLDTKEWKGIY
jgi:hypothetical protein